MENGLEELNEDLGCNQYDYKSKEAEKDATVTAARCCVPALEMQRYRFLEIGKGNSSLRC